MTHSFEQKLNVAASQVEDALEALLSPQVRTGETRRPARLLAAMRHAALGGGKRLRPFLTLETAGLFGVAPEAAMRAACAIELIHCYSLVHDDLPAMDDDDLRRGRPTVHKAYDEATAILAGDCLLTYAFDILADPATHDDAGLRCQLVRHLALASGLGGMAGGQALDLEAERSEKPLTFDEILAMQAMKTGALLQHAVEAGALLGQASPAQFKRLSRFGALIGAAFQIADDLLDARSDAATLGKRAGKDAARNKATLVSILGVDAAEQRCDSLIDEAVGALQGLELGSRTDVLIEAARFVAGRTS
ncbi:MAG: polyprenyl synthetase family protein [Hyphomicrobiales bacterium]|nr:polyprenyl synthetase family protein [Hyphomicrobiales bacterium]